MSTNRVTLAQLDEMTTEGLNAIPLDQIALLLEDVAAIKAKVKSYDNVLFILLHGHLAEKAAQQRKAKGKDTGSVTFEIDGCKVTADLPKSVDWNQAKLREAVAGLVEMQEDPAEYVSTEHKVAEAKYVAWPKSLQKLFEPARTLGVGKPTYKVALKEAA
jgi:hypothetical protein